jgi:hypothetical protein
MPKAVRHVSLDLPKRNRSSSLAGRRMRRPVLLGGDDNFEKLIRPTPGSMRGQSTSRAGGAVGMASAWRQHAGQPGLSHVPEE